jgi:hypothetical protein
VAHTRISGTANKQRLNHNGKGSKEEKTEQMQKKYVKKSTEEEILKFKS